MTFILKKTTGPGRPSFASPRNRDYRVTQVIEVV